MQKKLPKPAKRAAIEFKPIELKLIKLLYKQHSNIEMAEILGKNIRTVEGYRKNILDKTKSRNSVGVILYALRKGICNL